MPKRQKDFPKTRLKVGRKITKGTNVTNTSFRSRRIVVPDQRIPSQVAEKSLAELLNSLKVKNVPQKQLALKRIQKYIDENEKTFSTNFFDILTRVGAVVLESDVELPKQAASVLISCITLLTDIQYQTHSRALLLHLKCMMSHGSPIVKQAALMVVESIVTAHPKIVTKQTEVLFNLLDMLSVKPANGARRLSNFVSTTITSGTWYQKVLTQIQTFLQELVKREDTKNEEDDDNYYDPDKINFNWYTGVIKSTSSEKKLDDFVVEFVQVLSGIIKEEVPRFLRKDGISPGVSISKRDAKFWNQIVQLLCYVGELAASKKLVLNDKTRKEIQDITKYFQSGFRFSELSKPRLSKGYEEENKEPDTSQLNLGLCYLFTVFILDSDCFEIQPADREIFKFLTEGFSFIVYTSKRSYSLILKISLILMKNLHIKDKLKTAIILNLLDLLTHTGVSDCSEFIYTFFISISLEPEYCNLLKLPAMDAWFKSLTDRLEFMIKSTKINAPLLKYIRDLCAKGHPEFISVLEEQETQFKLLKLLAHGDDDFQITVMYMITTVNILPNDYLKSINDFISEEIFTPNTSKRVIWLLYLRYSKPGVSNNGKVHFVKFLLNTACDTRSLLYFNDDLKEDDLVQYTLSILKPSHYRLYPTKKLKTYHSIIEICLECLKDFEENVFVQTAILAFLEIFLEPVYRTEEYRYSYPVHSVAGYLSLRKKFGAYFNAPRIIEHHASLLHSCFLYISAISYKAFHEMKLYGVHHLETVYPDLSIGEATLSCRKGLESVICCTENLEEDYIDFTLKTSIFLLRNNKININDSMLLNRFNELAKRVKEEKRNHLYITFNQLLGAWKEAKEQAANTMYAVNHCF